MKNFQNYRGGQPYTDGQTKILNAFNAEEYILDMMFVADYCLYDRCVTPPGQMTPPIYQFYTNVGPASGKALADTNMVIANQLPLPQAFAINKSIFFLQSHRMLESDRAQLFDNYAFELRMGRKFYAHGPMARFPNYCDTAKIDAKPFDHPPADEGTRKRNQEWIRDQQYAGRERGKPEDEPILELPRANPQLSDKPINKQDQQISLVIENGQRFIVEVIGRPFVTDPNGTGVNFMSVLDGLCAFGIQ